MYVFPWWEVNEITPSITPCCVCAWHARATFAPFTLTGGPALIPCCEKSFCAALSGGILPAVWSCRTASSFGLAAATACGVFWCFHPEGSLHWNFISG